MSKREPPSQEALEKLLAWLDPDRERAAEKYQHIYTRIVKILAAKGCWLAEDLADQTFNVVASQIDRLRETFHGDPALYFYGVARKIHQEWLKTLRPPPSPPPGPDRPEIEYRCGCLEKCLEKLATPEEAQMALRYHKGKGQERREDRKRLAEELGISLNALRIRICHLQARLRPCCEECVKAWDR
ncbi:MAG TPA: hypothetical protein VJ749_11775 [Pyrinomonadaceae bacterium]|jgi:hypothetical protein|nr:hypothetical protein [Pyrinomonadaceae bacterium]